MVNRTDYIGPIKEIAQSEYLIKKSLCGPSTQDGCWKMLLKMDLGVILLHYINKDQIGITAC